MLKLFGTGFHAAAQKTLRPVLVSLICRRMPRFQSSCAFRLATLFAAALVCFLEGRAEDVSFRNDVMAVLSKAGCNAGGCHGNANGKAGFKLSLRGQDPDLDYAALTREEFGRRTNPLEPAQSLVLLKATTTLTHEGGKRFSPEAPEYATLLRWIAEGATSDVETAPKLTRIEVVPREQFLVEPASAVAIRATAYFSDGTQRDVTRQAVYDAANQVAKIAPDGLVSRESFGETTVLVRYLDQQLPVRIAFIPARPDFKWANARPENFIDGEIFAKLKTLRMNPSARCTDEIFLRRSYLDLVGLLPSADEARAFVADRRRDKRAKLVDRLLERPEFADFWALKWADLLRVEDRTLDRKGTEIFHRWIRQSFAGHKPLDQFARELVTARGSTYLNPPANFYRANRDPVTRAEAVAQVFLGTRLQCAQCHNHPFDRWTQNDYYDWAAVFAKVNYKVLRNDRRDDNDKHEFKGEQIVYLARQAEVKNPRLGKPAHPRVLGSPTQMEMTSSAGTMQSSDTAPTATIFASTNFRHATHKNQRTPADELEQLGDWLTSPTNPYFARSQANRIWFQLFGRGIVDPIDDFRPTNPPSHPALLDALAADLAKHCFDLHRTIRLIMNSQTYQFSSEPNDTNRDDELNFSRAYIRRLTAEQLLDAQFQVAGVVPQLRGYPAGTRAAQLPGSHTERRRGEKISNADLFLELFGKPQRLLTCECERSTDTTMGQAFQLISGPSVNELLTVPENRLSRLLASNQSDGELVAELYWTALTRTPTAREAERATTLLRGTKDRRAVLEDLTWSLLNAKEFLLRR